MSAATARLPEAAVRLLAEDAKLALLATVTAGGLPHLTLITSIQAKSPVRLMFGQFCEGLSKTHVRDNPLVGFLALDRQRQWIRGKARWSGSARQGEDYQAFNRKPMFRYNAYFGIHTVHYLDVVEVEAQRRLSTAPLVAGAIFARLAGLASLVAGRAPGEEALTPWSRKLIGQPASLKFLAYVGADGYPAIVPAVAATTQGAGRVVIVPTFGRSELRPVRAGSSVALFAIDLEMRSVMLRGVLRRWRGLGAASIDVEWVYNSMPPKHGQIYPAVPLAAVRFAESAR